MHIIIMGPAGSGKGTQAKLVAGYYKLPHISMGDLLRDVAKKKTKIGKYVDRVINKEGKLVPDELTTEVLRKRLAKKDCAGGFVLDGYPRNINQSKLLGPDFHIDYAIYLDVPAPVVIKRLSGRWQCRNQKCNAIYGELTKEKKKGVCDKCHSRLYQRADDKEAAIKQRLKIFNNLTRPLINYYRKKGVLHKVKGYDKTPAEIFESIKKILR